MLSASVLSKSSDSRPGFPGLCWCLVPRHIIFPGLYCSLPVKLPPLKSFDLHVPSSGLVTVHPPPKQIELMPPQGTWTAMPYFFLASSISQPNMTRSFFIPQFFFVQVGEGMKSPPLVFLFLVLPTPPKTSPPLWVKSPAVHSSIPAPPLLPVPPRERGPANVSLPGPSTLLAP